MCTNTTPPWDLRGSLFIMGCFPEMCPLGLQTAWLGVWAVLSFVPVTACWIFSAALFLASILGCSTPSPPCVRKWELVQVTGYWLAVPL